ncbi:MAG: S41 family peptidase [Gammaproteobacteria bacterium]|nr:S41 family peptidase [Gammaproteobacteria bacterium]
MKVLKRVRKLLILAISLQLTVLHAETKPLDSTVKKNTVQQIGELMIDNYVFPEVAKETAKTLTSQLEAGKFDDFNQPEALARALTDELQAITGDKHLRVRGLRSGGSHHSQEDAVSEHLSRREYSRQANMGVSEVRKLEGNVGYLELKSFSELSQAKPLLDSAMLLLSTSDAIIIDLRKNGGGDPATVQYLSSYFFDEKLLLNSLYWREGEITNEFWTLDSVDGQKMPSVPLYILTSSRTFSAAEEFSYNMQTRKRATLIGETTGGGANPGRGFRINDYFGMFIATGRAINPVTKTNWEGVGVAPEIEVKADEAFDRAVTHAAKAAEEMRQAHILKYKTDFLSFYQWLDSSVKDVNVSDFNTKKTQLFSKLTKFQNRLELNQMQLNSIGYEYLTHKQQPLVALLFMQFNVEKYPESANAYDSLGEVLLALDQPGKAKKVFEKGLTIIGENELQLQRTLTMNLEKAKQQLANQ